MKRFLATWRSHPVLTSATVIAVIVTVALTLRLILSVVYWSTHQNLPVESWMPAGYIARSHGVAVERIREAAGIAPGARDRRPIAELAREQGVPVEELVRRIEAEIAASRQDGKDGTSQQ